MKKIACDRDGNDHNSAVPIIEGCCYIRGGGGGGRWKGDQGLNWGSKRWGVHSGIDFWV